MRVCIGRDSRKGGSGGGGTGWLADVSSGRAMQRWEEGGSKQRLGRVGCGLGRWMGGCEVWKGGRGEVPPPRKWQLPQRADNTPNLT